MKTLTLTNNEWHRVNTGCETMAILAAYAGCWYWNRKNVTVKTIK